jgi:hypothetical protein
MIYFKVKKSKIDIVYCLNKKTGYVTWDDDIGCMGILFEPDEYREYFRTGYWTKCTKQGIELESNDEI